ncbi:MULTISPECIES: BolA family protein [unclassified Yoonia]|uniref:BolA family protein n=1 Tax=unclassified Yoonia TaxID=2629118 RepID=UPI002AFEEAB0|nr:MULTISPECIES: BolA family protein [unclassified Yoonia]
MALQAEIHARLMTLAPQTLDVINESDQHAGHAGHDGSGESHFRVVIKAAVLDDMSRIARHRAVHDAIGPDLMARIHALAIEMR